MKIQLEKLSKRYDREWIVKQFTYDFVAGNTYGISGRNGAGKSTLLRILAGHLSASRGRISFYHQDQPLAAEAVYPLLSYVGPYVELIEEFTLDELIRFHFNFKPLRAGLALKDLPAKMELSKARKRPLNQYSSGMKQRVMLGLALYADTPLLLLDEPTITLDKEGRQWFHQQLAEQTDDGRLIVIATNMAEDLAPCNQLIDMGMVRGEQTAS